MGYSPAAEWYEHHRDKETGRRVLSESEFIEHEHERLTAIRLAQVKYDVVKDGCDQASRIVIDINSAVDKKNRFYRLPKSLIENKRIYEVIK